MNTNIVLAFIKYIIIGSLLIISQNIISVYVDTRIALLDVLTIYIFLCLFHISDRHILWFFIVAHILGIIQDVWGLSQLGISSIYYLILSFPVRIYQNIRKTNFILCVFVILALLLKTVLYIIIGYVFNIQAIISFIFSIEHLYSILFTLILTIVLGGVFNLLLNKRKVARI